jgi:glutamate 5-kinase
VIRLDEAFRALTRAYEDVRYGRLTIDAGALRRLDREHRSLLVAIRRGPVP